MATTEQLSFNLVMDSNDLPSPVYIRDRKKISKLYERALKEISKQIIKELAVTDPTNIGIINQVKLMKQLELILKQLNGQVKNYTEMVVMEAIRHGQAVHLMKIAGIEDYNEALRQAGLTVLPKEMLEALVSDTFQDLLVATTFMEDSLKKTIRKTTAKVMQLKMAQNTGRVEMIDTLVKELSKKGLSKTLTEDGFVGIIDKRGRRWNLKTYADMVVTTKTQQAHVEGIKHEAKVTGYDLAIISDHNAKDVCRKWENVIISLNGQTKGFPTYEQVRRTKECFHPNCEHTLLPIRSVDNVHKDILKEHEKKVKEGWKTIEKSKKKK